MKRLIVFTSLVLCFFLQAPASAAVHTMRVSPSISEISLDPGTSVEKNISSVNKGDVPYVLKLSTAPYSIINDKYMASFEPVPGRIPVNKWISFLMPDTATVQPGKTYDIHYKLSVPKSTPAGGYSAVIFAESTADNSVGSGVVAKNRIAHIIYINVNGDVKRQGNVDINGIGVVAFSPNQHVVYTANNVGGTNEKARVTTHVSTIFGQQVFSDTTERYVLPGTKRDIRISWNAGQVFGIYKVTLSSDFAGKRSSVSSWSVVIQPMFILLAVLLVFGMIWLNYSRTRTIKARHAKK